MVKLIRATERISFMAQYSIKDLEQLSGIKAHTIRIWEKRYQLIKPGRTNTNIRKYSDEDLRRLLNISILSRHGFKISRIASFQEAEISEKILHLSQQSHQYLDQIESLVVAMIELDEGKFNRILSASILKIGFEDTFIYIVYPFLEKIGILWQTGTICPAQEHFVSNLIRQKLIVAIDGSLNTLSPGAKKFLLFMQEDDHHELGLLFSHYLISRKGHKVLYLGSAVPLRDLETACAVFEPDYLVAMFVSHVETEIIQSYLRFFNEKVPDISVFVSGQQAVTAPVKWPLQVKLVKNPLEFGEKLKTI